MLEGFKKLGISDNIRVALAKKGFEEPTPIQKKVIPLLLRSKKGLIGRAQTGTGKTAAFGIPLVERLFSQGVAQALILTPTRELALQVAEEINSLRHKKALRIAAIYGGQSMELQLQRLQRGVDIVVGTPGRIKDHLKRGTLDLSQVKYVILDEADEMLNMGFIEDVEEIISFTPPQKQMLLFSATIPPRILSLAKKYMPDFELVEIDKETPTTTLAEQIYFEVTEADKMEALCRIVDSEPDFYGLVFCRTKVDVDILVRRLSDRGYEVDGLHGDISQHQRERILNRFRRRRIKILVATDVAARGIDINSLSHVINYSLPQEPERYVHRIGRTGRAGKEGIAITFVTPREYCNLLIIQKVAKANIRREKIPTIADILLNKQKRIERAVSEIIEKGGFEEYLDFANQIIKEKDPQVVLASFIKYTLGDELSSRNYRDIREVSVDKKGTARLFVARGRQDGMNFRSLSKMIREVSGVEERKIRDIRIFERFSFISVPFAEAELILHAFKKKNLSKRPLVSRARQKNVSRKR